MGEWSNYLKDNPAETPASYITDKFSPPGARWAIPLKSGAMEDSAEMRKILAASWQAEKEMSFVTVEPCPQCGLDELNIYNINNRYCLCECQDCGIYGQGENHAEALQATEDAIGEGIDWRYDPIPRLR